MKIVLQDSTKYLIRFDKGEEVLEGLKSFMKEQGIKACVFNGIGACETPELAFYNPHVKEYRKKAFLEEMEIASLIGNGSMKDGEPIIHAHGLFTKNDFTSVGGHVFKLPISVTCEVFLTKLEGELKRVNNVDFNLNLLD